MRLTAFVLALLGTASVAGAQGVEAPREIGTPLMFEVSVRQYGPNNRPASSAGNSGTSGRFESYVWTTGSLCGLTASGSEPTSVAGVGWHFTGEVVGSTRESGIDQLIVNVEWKRLWDNGARLTNGPGGSQRITLRNGERLELDRVLPAGQNPCGVVETKLEAAVIATPPYRLTTVNGRLAIAGGRGGRGGAAGGGAGAGASTGMQSGVAGGARGMGRGDAGVGAAGAATAGGGRGVATGAMGGAAGRGATAVMSGQRGQEGLQGRQGQQDQQGRGVGVGVGGGRGVVAAGSAVGVGGRGSVGAGAAAGAGGRGGMTSTFSGRGTGDATTNVTAGGRSSTVMGQGGGRGGRGSADTAANLTSSAQSNLDRARLASSTSWQVANRGSYDAELWLVHRRPDGPETVQLQSIQFGGSVAEYRFPPIQVTTSRGVITLDITGSLRTFLGDPPDPGQPNRIVVYRNTFSGSDPQPAPRIMLSISRRARANGAPLLDITGGSSMAIDMPPATDVLSFEFPALQKATEDLLKGHQFSLRVRVTPIAR